MKLSENLKLVYQERYNDDIHEWMALCAKYKADNIMAVSQNLVNIEKVLEVGAGEGNILQELDNRKYGKNLFALEISQSGIEKIITKNIESLKEAKIFNGYDIPYPDKYFDVVILSHVIEHVEHPRSLLREIKRVSAFQIIELPLDYSENIDRKVDHYLSYGHINIYLPVQLRFLLISEGLAPIMDKVTINTKDVLFYNEFVNIHKPKNLLSELSITIKYLIRKMIIDSFPRKIRERVGNAYTVLCKSDDSSSLQIYKRNEE